MGQIVAIRPEEIVTPSGLSGYALFAWTAAIRSMDPVRGITHADMLSLEAACRAWARWKSLEEKIEELSRGNALAGELSRNDKGMLQVSAMRQAADRALGDFKEVARSFGIALPGSRVEVPDMDLFGYPNRAGRGQKGRPRFAPSARDHNRVRMLLAMGWSNARIAAALEVSLPTLRRYFRAELKEREHMRDRLDARRLELLMDQAQGGSVAALRELDRMIEKNDMMAVEREFSTGARGEKEEKPGKKQVADQMAADADAELTLELEDEARRSVRH